MIPDPAQQKAELYAHRKQVEANLAIARQHSDTLAASMESFQEATALAVNGDDPVPARLVYLAEGMRLFAKAQKYVVDSSITALEAQQAQIEKILRRLESPLHLPVMNPPYPGGRR